MKALVLRELKCPLQLEDRDDLVPDPGEAIVALKAAALNRRDYWITQGMYPGIKLPIVLGSDGAGIVTRVGQGVSTDLLQREMVINPGWNWGDNEAFQSDEFRILGMPHDGTFASEVKVPATYLVDKPRHLSWHEAGALPLAGVTAYRAVFTQGRLQPGERVLISGAGGGVATFALQYALAAGATVFVTSSSVDKIDRAIQLGATAGFDYTADGWHKQLVSNHGSIDLVIDSAGGDGYANLVDVATPGGRIVNYGATAGPPKKLDLFKVFWKQLHLIGSTMGSPADFAKMIDFVGEHEIKPVVDKVFSLGAGNDALERMKNSQQFGKLVIDTTS
ncbi:MAG TPA: zinc-binding dehydrogenase [Pirellulaceae bacterium]|nr:zinc-binding dehydrogenase [Pirellulaceae bacterium]